MKGLLCSAILGVAWLVVACGAQAGETESLPAPEARPVPGARLLLNNVLSQPIARQRQVAFDESIKRPAPAQKSPLGEVQPDGSVKYGSVAVSVKNPCPPGEHFDEPPPLPGRRARK